jgi:plastocyanin
MLRHLAFFALATSPSLVGCSEEETTPRSTDTGVVDTGTASVKDSASADTESETAVDAPEPINECAESDFVDATASDTLRRLDPWAFETGKKCLRIKQGQSVTWVPELGFSAHPLEADLGDSPTPIMLINTGTTATVAFPNVGIYGYHCANHPAVMKGAIRVVP